MNKHGPSPRASQNAVRTPRKFGPKPKPLAERFWKKVQKSAEPNGCWIWLGHVNGKCGYGMIYDADIGTKVLAHRAAWKLAYGCYPEGVVRHVCDNTACVRIDHLEEGTQAENMQEMKARGHSLNHLGPPKISFEIAEEIRALFRGGKFSQCELGTLYGVHQGTVSRIVLGKMHQLPSQATLPKVDPPPRPVVRKLSIEERFWAKVDKNGPVPSHCPDVGQCWIWTAAKVGSQGDQRGSFRRTSRRSELAHRVSWELTNGSIPEGLVVCHRCDLGLCVRPDHLFLGTQEENMLDMWHKCRAWNVQKGLHGKPPRI